MKQMKILFVAPASRNKLSGEGSYFKFPTLSLPTIAAYSPQDCKLEIVDECIQSLDFELDADLVAITAITPLAPRAYEIAGTFKQKGKTVVMGGIHPSALPEEALEHCDAVAVGEGEMLWPQMVEDFKNNELKKIYRADRLFDTSTTRPPRGDIVEKGAYSPVDFIESARSSQLYSGFSGESEPLSEEYRTKPLDLIENLAAQAELSGRRFNNKNLVFFVDENIIGSRNHCNELLDILRYYNVHWVGQAPISVAEDEVILKKMSKTRCLGLLTKMDNLFEQGTADRSNSANRAAEYLASVDKLHSYGIGVKADFMVGFDSDDASIFHKMASFIQKSKLDGVGLSLMTPFPGTPFFKEMEEQGRLLHRDWEKYDTAHIVFQPAGMTPQELHQGFIWLYKRVLSYRSIAMRLLRARIRPGLFIPVNMAMRHHMKQMVKTLKQASVS